MIEINKYYDWWFDNSIEFLGYLLEDRLKITVNWQEDKISFENLNDEQIKQLISEIERLIDGKLKYQKKNEKTGVIEKKNRAYLPTMHIGKYVCFLALKITQTNKDENKLKLAEKARNQSIKDITNLFTENKKEGNKICDICGQYTSNLQQVSQAIYPSATGSLKSQCGVRKMKPDYKCCNLCAFLGSIEWLDDYPFICDHKNLTHYLLFPQLDDLSKLHGFKNIIKSQNYGIFNQGAYSNISNLNSNNSYSLLLNIHEILWEKMKSINGDYKIKCDEWIELKIKGTDAKYQTKYSYIQTIKIPNIERMDKIFNAMFDWGGLPYASLIKHTIAKPLKKGNIDNNLSDENQYLMSKGILMDDFKTFAEAFKIRKNHIVGFKKDAGDFKDIKDKLNILIDSWRGV